MMMEYSFEDVLTIRNGRNQKAVENPNGKYPIYGSGGIMGYADDFICSGDTVIIGRKGNINNPIYVSEPFWNVDTAFGLESKNDLLNPRYLFYFCKRFDFEKLNKTVTIPSLTKSDLLKIRLNVPELSIQEEIVSKLVKLEKIVQLRLNELQKLDELVKARFVEMFGDPIQNTFGWEKKRFDEICENLDSRRKPITSTNRVKGIYPYYGASGIVDYVEDYIFDEDILLVSEDGANLLMRSTPIAFSVSGKVWVNNHAHVVKFEKMCLQKYIEIYFSLVDITDSITGSAQPKLNQAKLNAMEFPIPDESRLEKYFDFLKQIDKSKVAIQKSLAETQLLFDKLMQDYFG